MAKLLIVSVAVVFAMMGLNALVEAKDGEKQLAMKSATSGSDVKKGKHIADNTGGFLDELIPDEAFLDFYAPVEEVDVSELSDEFLAVDRWMKDNLSGEDTADEDAESSVQHEDEQYDYPNDEDEPAVEYEASELDYERVLQEELTKNMKDLEDFNLRKTQAVAFRINDVNYGIIIDAAETMLDLTNVELRLTLTSEEDTVPNGNWIQQGPHLYEMQNAGVAELMEAISVLHNSRREYNSPSKKVEVVAMFYRSG